MDALEHGAPERVLARVDAGPQVSNEVVTPVRGLSPVRALPRRSRARRWALGAGGLVAAAAAVLVVLAPSDPMSEVAALQGKSRPLEAALSGLPYAPYAPTRGAVEARPGLDRTLRKLLEAQEKLRPQADRALATFYVLRSGPGDAARARELFSRGGGPDVLNDRGAALFARGDLFGALDLFLEALNTEPKHRSAQFNRALVLSRLVPEAAVEQFRALARSDPQSPFAQEAAERAQRLAAEMEAAEKTASPYTRRREACVALLSAATPEQLQEARAKLLALPVALRLDADPILALMSTWTPAQLAAHGRRFEQYRELRGRTMAGKVEPAELAKFAADVAADPLIAVPALQLQAFRLHALGDRRGRDQLYLRSLEVCAKVGCMLESKAIATDELADDAAADGDLVEARKWQNQAEAWFSSIDAELMLSEVQRKRANRLLSGEGMLDEAQEGVTLSLRTLSMASGVRSSIEYARAWALAVAGEVSARRGYTRAAYELQRIGFGLALKAGPESGHALQLGGAMTESAVLLGIAGDTRTMLERELLANPSGAWQVSLHRWLAQLDLERDDVKSALGHLDAALAKADLAGNSLVADLQRLRGVALLKVGRAADGRAALLTAVGLDEKLVGQATDPGADQADIHPGVAAAVAWADASRAEVLEPGDLLVPLDRLRAASVHAQAVADGWARKLPAGLCVVALLPAEGRTLVVQVPGAVQERPIEGAALASLVASAQRERAQQLEGKGQASVAQDELARALFPQGNPLCAGARELWLLATGPLQRVDLTALPIGGVPLALLQPTGVVTSLARLLVPEQRGLGRDPVFVHDIPANDDQVELPAAALERQALLEATAQGQTVAAELSGERATPEAVLARFADASLLHLSVHGVTGDSEGGRGALLLAGPQPRLSASTVAQAKLSAQARVVLPACHAASPSISGLPFAFARAGAGTVVAAAGPVDDGAAGAWSGAFYAALQRGESSTAANHEALRKLAASGGRPAWFVVMR
ncbi:MAG: CHAT domain-containing protein [Deltaproteobacteria bacterium]|nr:CHAT domain-containing protein [Deltaproteobacteria bacterium]